MAFLEDYTLLDELGQGGDATVYKVRHNQLGYIRAIRVINKVIARGESDKIYQKFLEECKLLLRIGNGNHPNIVHIYQPLLRDQHAIVEMDFVDGKDLFHYLQNKSFFVEIGDIMKLLTDIGSALAYCHEDIYKFCMDKEEDNLKDDPQDGSKVLLDEAKRLELIGKYRVIHNDIHSGNIIRREDGNFVLLDFGLSVDGDTNHRISKKRGGVPEFKAPEKWDDEGMLTPQSDIYSFGVVLYEYVTGRVPFIFDKNNSRPEEAEALLGKAHRESLPQPIFQLRKVAFEHSHSGMVYQKDYPDWLEELIMKCLAKNPNDRFKNGKELFSYVQEHLSTDSYSDLVKYKEENEKLHKIIEAANVSKVKIDELVLDLQDRLKESGRVRETLDKRIKTLQNENDKLSAQLESLSITSQKLSKDQVQQIKKLTEQLDSYKKKLESISRENDSLKDVISGLKPTPGGKKGKFIWIIIFFLCILITYLYFNRYLVNEGGNSTTSIELSEQEEIRYTIDTYYKNITDKRYSELTSMYTPKVQRYYDTYDITPSQIIKDLKSYDQKVDITSKDIYVDWNTLNVSKNKGKTSISYDVAYIINRKDKTKSSVFQLKMYVDLDQQYKICSIYEVIEKEFNNFSTVSSNANVSGNQELITNLNKQIQEKENHINNLTAQIQSLNSEISNLKSSNQGLVNQNTNIEHDNLISDLRAQLQAKEKQIDNQTLQIKSLNSEISNLKSSNRGSVNQSLVTERDNKISQLQVEIKKLNEIITEKDKLIKSMNENFYGTVKH